MKITIGVPVMNQHELTMSFLDLIFKNTNQIDEILLVDNGSQPHILEYIYQNRYDYFRSNKITVIRNNQNVGVREALNQILQVSHGDVIVYSHNDVEFLEKGWDDKVREAFEKHPEAGIIGAYGAKGIGTNDIYQTPYVMQQLARQFCVSNCPMDKEVHGFRNMDNEYENVAVFDGFFMAIKKELLDKTKGFSNILPEHHGYDNLICIQSLEQGYENILISLGLNHIGGQTDVKENWSVGFGKTKQEIHRDSHPPLYEYCRGKLPIMISDIYNENAKICGYELYLNRKLVKTKIYD
jgi:glycosyltransferase involved in cell wall biosynthesis